MFCFGSGRRLVALVGSAGCVDGEVTWLRNGHPSAWTAFWFSQQVVPFLLAGSEVFYSGLSPSQPVFVFVLNKTRRSSGCVRSLVCRSIHVGLGLGSH